MIQHIRNCMVIHSIKSHARIFRAIHVYRQRYSALRDARCRLGQKYGIKTSFGKQEPTMQIKDRFPIDLTMDFYPNGSNISVDPLRIM